MAIADRIHLRDHVVEIEIGAFAGEHGTRQRLRASVEAELAARVSAAGDDVDRVLSYDVLVDAVAGALAARRYDLLEALAEDVAARVLAHPAAAAVHVTLEKLDRVSGRLGVSISRARGEVAAVQGAAPAVRVMAAPEAGATGGFGAGQGAAVLVAQPPGLALPADGDRWQLALLALDQGAWAAAGRLGLDVVDSRTEILAAAAAGQAVVWAPARMLRAAAGLDRGVADETARLVAWLEAELGG